MPVAKINNELIFAHHDANRHPVLARSRRQRWANFMVFFSPEKHDINPTTHSRTFIMHDSLPLQSRCERTKSSPCHESDKLQFVAVVQFGAQACFFPVYESDNL